ncbi:Uncharacterized protein APZ42_008034, partial [Daphnia magna]
RLVKNSIDEKDSAACTVDGMNEQVLDRCTPYLRDFDFDNAFSTVVIATPQMLDVFAESIFLQVDVTYPGTNAFPYMLNFVTYNDGKLVFQTVARVLMNRLTVAAYKFA